MIFMDKHFYCHAWEKKAKIAELKKIGYEIKRVEHVTKGKVVIVAKDKFK